MRIVALAWICVVACAQPEEPELSEVEQGLMQCSACSAASNCNSQCTDEFGGTDFCISYACGNDPCSSSAATAIEARRTEYPAWSCTSTLTPITINGVSGAYRSCTQGRIVWSPDTCAARMPAGTIYNRYFVNAGNANVRDAVGFPIDAPLYGNANGIQLFEHGYLATNASNVAAIVGGRSVPPAERGALIAKFAQPIAGKMPAHDTVWIPGRGAYFTTSPYLGFDQTFTVKAGSSQAYVVRGEVQNKYEAMGRWDSSLGWPTSDELCLDVPCRFKYSNFEGGHIRWAAGPDRAYVAMPLPGKIPSVPRAIVYDNALAKMTFAFRLSRSLKANIGDRDSDQDGLSDDAEKELAFLTAPRIFWDEGETCAENKDPVTLRRLDMVQVRPRSPSVSTWQASQGRKWITLRWMMEYPMQCGDHIGDSEMVEVRLFSADANLSEWRVGEFVFPPHGGQPGGTFYYQYYGNVDVLARRAQLLDTTYLWIAADENKHGSWGGSEVDSEECKGGGIVGHDCFDHDLQEALAAGNYWWFDPSRDIGEPEALRYDAWPLEARGPAGAQVVPQIRREPNNLNAAYIENNTGYGVAREYIRYREPAEIPTAKAFCGWRCPARNADGSCAHPGPWGYTLFGEPLPCDGGGSTFPTTDFTTSLYGSLYIPGESFYHTGPVSSGASYQHADFTYQLWGNPNIKPLRSGNVANHLQYSAFAAAPNEYNATTPMYSVNDGDRKGHGWAAGGGWSSRYPATEQSAQPIAITFDAAHWLGRVEIFTVQNTPDSPVEPTATTPANLYGIRDYEIQYCPATNALGCYSNVDLGWTSIMTVRGNDKAWRTHTFNPVNAKGIRIRVLAANGTYARITEIEAWE